MSNYDAINAAFELIGGCLLWLNVRRLYRDKTVRGVAILPTVFFFLWGAWNLKYYPHLGQWLSFYGGINIAIANAVWLSMMLYYTVKEWSSQAKDTHSLQETSTSGSESSQTTPST